MAARSPVSTVTACAARLPASSSLPPRSRRLSGSSHSSGAWRVGTPPSCYTYTTTVTDVLDLSILVPTMALAAILIVRRVALGYVLAAVLLVLLVFVAATIVAGTVFRLAADVEFTTGEIVGPIAGFLALAAIGLWLLARLLRQAGLADASSQQRPAQA